MQGEATLVVRIDQLLRRWRCLGEDAQPGEGVLSLVHGQDAVWDGRPAHPMEPIAASDDVAGQLLVFTILPVTDRWLLRPEVVDAGVLGLEDDLSARIDPGADEVLHHLVLAINRDRPPA